MNSVDRNYIPILFREVPSPLTSSGLDSELGIDSLAQETLRKPLPQPPSNESLPSAWSWSDIFSGAVNLASSPAYAVAGFYQRWSLGSSDDNIDGGDSCCRRFSACSDEGSVVMGPTSSTSITIETLREFIETMIQSRQSQADFSLLDITGTAGKFTRLEYNYDGNIKEYFVVTQFWRDYQRGAVFELHDEIRSSYRFFVPSSVILEEDIDAEVKKDLRCLRSYEALWQSTSLSGLKNDERWLPILQVAVSQNTGNALFGKIMLASLDVGSKAMAEALPAFRFAISREKDSVPLPVDTNKCPIELMIHRNPEGSILSVDVSYTGFLDVVDASTQCILTKKAVCGEIRYTITLDEKGEVQINGESARFSNTL